MKKIEVNCRGTHEFVLGDLHVLQDAENFKLKELGRADFEKLRSRIEKKGFWFPFFFWHCKEEEKNYYTDGTQRHRVLTWMKESGEYEMPEKFPAVEIFARDKKEAAEAILTQSTAYGKVSEEGLYGFLHAYGLDGEAFNELRDELEIPGVDLVDFERGWLSDEAPPSDDDDEAPPLPDEPKTLPGDLYVLGPHRLLCGDALSAADAEKLMGGERADMVFTDPPYNVDYGGCKAAPSHKKRAVINDKQTPDEWKAFCTGLNGALKQNSTGDIYVWGASGPAGIVQRAMLIDAGCHWSATIVWKKQQFVFGRANYQRIYEPCFYGWFDKSSFVADRKQTELWEFDRPHKSDLHPTMKPVEMCAYGIKNSSKKGGLVLDLFLGSGSTLIACQKAERRCYGMELDPGYCDVIVARWEQYAGAEAVLVGRGEPEAAAAK